VGLEEGAGLDGVRLDDEGESRDVVYDDLGEQRGVVT